MIGDFKFIRCKKIWHPTIRLPFLFIISQFLTSTSIAEITVKSQSLSKQTDVDVKEDLGKANKSGVNKEENFYPNITSGAKTAGPGKVKWQPSPIRVDSISNFFANSLTVGIGERLEIGITPFDYAGNFLIKKSPEVSYDTYQALLKYSFFESKSFSLAIASSLKYTHIRMKFKVPNNSTSDPNTGLMESYNTFKIDSKTYSVQYVVLTNYRLESGWELGTNFESRYIWGNSSASNDYYSRNAIDRRLIHIRSDLMQPVSSWLRATYSVSREYLPRTEEDLFSYKLTHGFGFGCTWVRPGKTFSSIGLGLHHYVETNSTSTIFNLSFD
jgi:hypothetical protein